MSVLEMIVIALSLAMDAFAVSICKGLSMKRMRWKNAIVIALYFGVFQAIMPVIGYLLGISFTEIVEQIDHFIAFILLLIIGINMIKSSFDDESENRNDKIDVKTMILLALATSIDALAIGVTFAFLNTNIFISSPIIGIVTFILSLIGVKVGNRFGDKFQNKAEIIGGITLILIGLKILLEHLNCF